MPQKPCKKDHFFKYSPQWARNIAEKLIGKYARAAEILAEEIGLNTEKLWMYLATNSPKWAIIRNLLQKSNLIILKVGDEALRRAIRQCPTTQLLSGLEDEDDEFTKFRSHEDLTELLCWLTMKGQGFRGC